MKSQENTYVTLYVLNDYLKFEKKIYQLFGMSFGRAIPLKTISYFVVIFAIEMLILFTPGIKYLINWMPFVFLVALPLGLAYLLADVKTEGRSSVAFFRSVILYNVRKLKKVTYIRNKEIAKPSAYQFKGYSVVTFTTSKQERKKVKKLHESNA